MLLIVYDVWLDHKQFWTPFTPVLCIACFWNMKIMIKWLQWPWANDSVQWCVLMYSGTTTSVTLYVPSEGEKDVRSHAQHYPGHGEHGRLRRVRELPAQSLHWVGQIQRIRHLPQQTQPGQETRQPAGNRALLFHSKCWPTHTRSNRAGFGNIAFNKTFTCIRHRKEQRHHIYSPCITLCSQWSVYTAVL